MTNLLDSATRFENPVEVFNAPTQTVPAQALNRIFREMDIDGRQQEPLDSCGSFGRRSFHRMKYPDVDGSFVGIILWWTQLNPLIAHFQLRLTAGPFRTGFFLTELRPGALARYRDLNLRLQWSMSNRFEEFEGFIGDAAVV